MIRAFLTPLTNKIGLGIIVALALFAGVQSLRLANARAEIADMRREQAERAAQAVAQARKADEAAHAAVAAEKGSAGLEIDRGREAAAKSDDPWKAATEAMRK